MSQNDAIFSRQDVKISCSCEMFFFFLSLELYSASPERETNDAVASRSCLLPNSLVDRGGFVGQVLKRREKDYMYRRKKKKTVSDLERYAEIQFLGLLQSQRDHRGVFVTAVNIEQRQLMFQYVQPCNYYTLPIL
jgi:hypothetical protein